MSYDKERLKQAKAHNERLLREVKEGYNCAPVAMFHYFFPPRPIIKKDPKALEFIHKKKADLHLAE